MMYIYKFMTLLLKGLLSIPNNGAKNMLRTNDVYIQIYDITTKDYYLIPGSSAKKLLRPNDVYVQIYNIVTK